MSSIFGLWNLRDEEIMSSYQSVEIGRWLTRQGESRMV
jgi:hypothetical protein